MLRIKPPPTNRKRISDEVLIIPDRTAGLTLSPLNNLSESQPARTVPSMPKTAEKAMTCEASASSNPRAFCRKSTPHPATAYFVMYMNALDNAITHIPGCFRTIF